ncbi:hypothetical protein [Pseudochrobactrum asaccharolyticum]|uniref:Uncharacterized protein n=1 Tax=Pseudochrobactrum asaccharolyticum TaxID=354351 RepID=A0A366E7Z2_9HYPH|nr:hypothetical protein [Pseudochrobactrum asaccharolyticum]MBX8800710.1 hypothetical protein [Ochrobactrum sp. MR28]MBX8818124.1 hypothetical protein [Ochrobactrum sp. MR31]RBO98417.1 hypothetical protein DFR47_10111 [Pseudochrobactrum asaccharolyticum]
MPTVHLKPISHRKNISRIEITIKRAISFTLTAFASTAALSSLAFANEITFQEGYWAGQPIPNDQDFGCHMAMMLDDETMLSIYANTKGRFDLTFRSDKWSILQEKDVEAQLDLDDQPITFTRVYLLNQQVIVIRGTTPADNKRLEDLIRKASDLKVAFPKLNYVGQTAFYDNNLAVTALKNCIKTAQRQSAQ